MNDPLGSMVIRDAAREFANQRTLAERAIAQLRDEDLFHTLDPEANSVALLMKHIGGNLRSRWTDFLTTDGEKSDRNRDGEFLIDTDTRASITNVWITGWQTLERTLQELPSDVLLENVTIRGAAVPVVEALHRSLAHTAQHVGQIIMMARHLRGAEWQTLSIPRQQR